MILKNKTVHTQSLYGKDGEVLAVARPYRTVTLDEKVEFDSKIWEEEGKVEPKKSTNKGE